MKTDYEKTKDLETEAAATVQFNRTVYDTIGKRELFQQAVLRSLAIIIKLLLRVNEKL